VLDCLLDCLPESLPRSPPSPFPHPSLPMAHLLSHLQRDMRIFIGMDRPLRQGKRHSCDPLVLDSVHMIEELPCSVLPTHISFRWPLKTGIHPLGCTGARQPPTHRVVLLCPLPLSRPETSSILPFAVSLPSPRPSFLLRPNPHYRSTPRTAGGLRNRPALGSKWPRGSHVSLSPPLPSSPLPCSAQRQTMLNALFDQVTDIITFGSSASRQHLVLLRL
jgi:hypothetical protein